MDRESLKTIWGLVDDPIDNKLDILEFGLAMHLIVCITKKGLPMPPAGGGLPESLARMVRESRGKAQGGSGGATSGSGSLRGGQLPVIGGTGVPQGMQQPGEVGVGTPSTPGGTNGSAMMQQQQQPMMNGGTMPPPQPQPGQPQMGGMQYLPKQPVVQSQMGVQARGGFGDASSVGGHTIDDAFAGLSNDPNLSFDEFTSIGGDATARGVAHASAGNGMSTIGEGLGSNKSLVGGVEGGMASMAGLAGLGGGQPQPQPLMVEIASPESFTPSVQPGTSFPPLPLETKQQQQQQKEQQAQLAAQQQLKAQQQQLVQTAVQQQPTPSATTCAARSTAQVTSDSPSAEILQLREAHQKLSAEVIGLRAKASLVSEEELATQEEVIRLAGDIGRLSLELSALKEEVIESKVKLSENVVALKMQMEKKE